MFELLHGIRIVDLTTVVLGPYATQILGDLGADVVKVESPEGDVFRSVRPGRAPDLGVQFQNHNRNKRSIVIDLKHPDGRAVLHRLVKDADVFVHNMRSSSAADLGASFEELHELNPHLVYCHSAGFGDDGPDRDAPAYDDIIQARSGLAQLNADEHGAPQFSRTLVGDKTVGLHLAIAVLAGIVRRERTGEGVCIAAPMLESLTSFLLLEHLAGHSLVPPEGELGYSRLMSSYRRPYETKDGYVAILPYSTRHWQRFFSVSSTPEMAAEARVTDPAERSKAIDQLYQAVAREALLRTTDEWLRLLEELDIPCARVNSLTDLMQDPHLQAVGLFQEIDGGALGRLEQVRSPFTVNRKRFDDDSKNRVAPRLGEHTKEILEEAGFDRDEVAALFEQGIVTRRTAD